MIVLGFDTATPATAVGLRLADGSSLQARDDPPVGARPGHSAQLLVLADELLRQARLSWDAVERIAVGLGPGTFTGLRIGAATAQGLARSLAVELVGVSTLKALALAALEAPGVPTRAAVLAVIDARRGEAFAAAYAPGLELTEARALAPQALAAVMDEVNESEAGMREWTAVGDGAIRFRAQLEAGGIAVAPDSSSCHQVRGSAICELALAAAPVPARELVPDYRRRPDAEITLEGAIKLKQASELGQASQLEEAGK